MAIPELKTINETTQGEKMWMPLRSDCRFEGLRRMCTMAHSNIDMLNDFADTDWLTVMTLYEVEKSVQIYTGELVAQDLRTRLWQLNQDLVGINYKEIDSIPDLNRTKRGLCVLGKAFGAVSAQVEFDPNLLLSVDTTRWNVERAVICTRHLSTLGRDEGKYIFEVVESAKSWYWMVSLNPLDRDFFHNPQDRESQVLYKSEVYPVTESAFKNKVYVRSTAKK